MCRSLVCQPPRLTDRHRERAVSHSTCLGSVIRVRNSPCKLICEELTLNFSLLASGRIKPVIYSRVYSLEEAMEGLCALERRETWGKVIVHVHDEDKKAVAKL